MIFSDFYYMSSVGSLTCSQEPAIGPVLRQLNLIEIHRNVLVPKHYTVENYDGVAVRIYAFLNLGTKWSE
jgi:hypothetical protein